MSARDRVRSGVLGLVITTLAAACGATGDQTAGSTGTAPAETSDAEPAEASEATAPAATRSETQPPGIGGLTGYGATREAWESVRGESVAGFADGAVYGPQVRGGTHEYFGVVWDDVVTFYSRAFPDATDLDAARSLVLLDFPSDAAATVEDRDEPECLIVLIESGKVRAVTGGDALAAFFSESDDVFDDGDVSDATVLSALGVEGSDLGSC